MTNEKLEIIETSNAKEHIRSLLMDGWILIHGDTKAIQAMEEAVYKPGTKHNNDFRIITGINEEGKLYAICLGKKNPNFRRMCSTSVTNIRSITLYPLDENMGSKIHTFESIDLKEGVDMVLNIIKELYNPPNW